MQFPQHEHRHDGNEPEDPHDAHGEIDREPIPPRSVEAFDSLLLLRPRSLSVQRRGELDRDGVVDPVPRRLERLRASVGCQALA